MLWFGNDLGVNPTFAQGISKAMVDVASLNGSLLNTTLIPIMSTLTKKPEWNLPAGFSADMLARQTPRVIHMWELTKDSVRKIISYMRDR